MTDTANTPRERFDAATVRFAHAYAPVAQVMLQYEKQKDPSSEDSASSFLNSAIRTIISRFITSDGTITEAEAAALDSFQPGSDLAWIANAAGGIRRGPLFEGVEQAGDDELLVVAVRVLASSAGEPEVDELVAAARDLALATCELDGRTSDEDGALEEFEAHLAAAVAETRPATRS